MTSLTKIRHHLQQFYEHMREEDLREAIDGLSFIKEQVKKIEADMDGILMEYLEEVGDFEHGDLRYYVGKKKKTKVRSLTLAFERLLASTGGDMDAFCEYLSANPFKPGTVKSLAGQDVFDELFSEIEEKDIKTGKPKKVVKKVNPKFMPNKKESK